MNNFLKSIPNFKLTFLSIQIISTFWSLKLAKNELTSQVIKTVQTLSLISRAENYRYTHNICQNGNANLNIDLGQHKFCSTFIWFKRAGLF